MQYSLCIATDVEGRKINLQFFYDSPPSIAQVLPRAYSAFDQLFKSKGYSRPFFATTVVIFNENHQTWDRLERSSQLVHNGQIYLFQPDVVDVPAEIPDPMPAVEFLNGYVSPHVLRDQSWYSESPKAAIPLTYGPRETFSKPSPMYEHSYHTIPSVNQRQRDLMSYLNHESSINNTSERYSYNNNNINNNYNYNDVGRHSTSFGIVRDGSQRRSTSRTDYPDIRGPSIIRDEREQLAKQSDLTLDEYRVFARKEAREFSPERVS